MEDEAIVALYWARKEQAIRETAKKYDDYLDTIARRILGDPLDAAECVNDTYLAAWDSIPPHRPQQLSTYLAKLTRRIAMKIWRSRDTQKRGGGEIALSLEELSQCIPHRQTPEDTISAKELAAAIDTFLLSLPKTERLVFVHRYFYGCSIRELCRQFGFGKSKTETMLFRTRKKLKAHLQEEGYLYERGSDL